MSRVFLLVVLALLAGPGPPAAADVDALMELYEARDYFTLAERLAGDDPAAGAQVEFLRAAVAHAFNRPAESNELLRPLLDEDALPPALALRARTIELANHLRSYEYGRALDAARAALENPALEDGSERQRDLRNMVRMMQALSGVAPMRTVVSGKTMLRLVDGKVPLRIQGKRRRFAIDTGANLSVLMRSEAQELGLEILEAGIEVGTSTDLKVKADLAVAPRVRLGSVDYANVVFLVFPDELLTFPGGPTIRGLIGFPLLEAAGRVRFRRGDRLELSAGSGEPGLRNLALSQLEPLVRVAYGEEPMVCRLDTGANRTDFYEPFYLRYRERVEREGRRYESESGGVGGMRKIPAYELPSIRLGVGGREVTLENVDVYTVAITTREENDLACNLGMDLMGQFEDYTIDFRSMEFRLGEP